MSQVDDIKEYLLASIPGAKLVSGGRKIQCRCRECPDSADPTHAHMGINTGMDGAPFWYNCFKCGTKGILTYKKLIEWGIYDPDIADELTKYNATTMNFSCNKRYFSRTRYNVVNTHYEVSDNFEEKRRYINNRLGLNLSFKDLRDLKIVLNLKDFLIENHISKLTRDQRIVENLNDYFIGFLSVDNAYINMRRLVDNDQIHESINKRYINYDIFGKFDNSQRFYVVPTQVDLTKPERIKVHIAEGPFDILSIYENVRHRENGIYASVAGASYMNTLLYILLELRLPYVEFHLYPDNDKQGTDSRMKYIANSIADQTIPFYIHRNLYPNEKDFGVSPDRIHEAIIQIR